MKDLVLKLHCVLVGLACAFSLVSCSPHAEKPKKSIRQTNARCTRVVLDKLPGKWDSLTEIFYINGDSVLATRTFGDDPCDEDELVYKGIKLAIVEAKSNEQEVGEGVMQAKKYAHQLQLETTYSTNGKDIYQISMKKEGNEWISLEGTVATIGITEFAQGELGDIVYVDINTVGKTLAAEEVFGTVEAVKTVSDLFLPVSGTVTEVNAALEAQPELVNSDPYGQGWMIKMTVDNIADVEALLSAEAYNALVS